MSNEKENKIPQTKLEDLLTFSHVAAGAKLTDEDGKTNASLGVAAYDRYVASLSDSEFLARRGDIEVIRENAVRKNGRLSDNMKSALDYHAETYMMLFANAKLNTLAEAVKKMDGSYELSDAILGEFGDKTVHELREAAKELKDVKDEDLTKDQKRLISAVNTATYAGAAINEKAIYNLKSDAIKGQLANQGKIYESTMPKEESSGED